MSTAGVLRDALDRLVRLGLEEGLAAIYLHLLVHGPGRPSALALALKTSRAGVYRRLEALVEQGLVIAGRERPVVYHPAEPTMVFQVLHDQNVRRAEASRAVREELRASADRFEAMSPPPAAAGTTFRFLSGRTDVYDEVHRLLDDVDGEVVLVNTHPAAADLAQRAGLWERLAAHVEAGVRVQLLMADGPGMRRHGRGCAGAMRVLPPGDILRFLVVDRRRILLCIESDGSSWMDSPLEKVVVTDASGFLSPYLILFQNLWREGIDIEETAAPNLSKDSGYSNKAVY